MKTEKEIAQRVFDYESFKYWFLRNWIIENGFPKWNN